MSEIKWNIEPDDVEWEMDWGDKVNSRGVSGKQMIFEKGMALAQLLLNEVVFTNSYWWKHEKLGDWSKEEHRFAAAPDPEARWTKEESRLTSLSVNCNDVFAWGCSDSESLPYAEIENLWRMWRKDPSWGSAIWCMVQRNQMPQKPVEDILRKAGIWDLDKLGLGKNTMDDECKAYLAAMVRS